MFQAFITTSPISPGLSEFPHGATPGCRRRVDVVNVGTVVTRDKVEGMVLVTWVKIFSNCMEDTWTLHVFYEQIIYKWCSIDMFD